MAQAPLPIAILAGGLATRLRPITETMPKALVPVAGRPFLAHQLELLHRHGLRDVVLCVGYLGEQIVREIGDGRAFDLRVQYSFDGPELRGTAGALRQALPLLGDAFLVLYGDSYLEIDYADVQKTFHQAQSAAVMTVMENSRGTEKSNVWYEGGLVREYNKKTPRTEMRYIDYGLNVYRAEVFQQFPAADLSDVQSTLATAGQLVGYPVTIPYHEIGSHAGLAALEKHLAS